MMQEPQEVVEETVTIEEDPGTPTSRVSVVTSEDGTTRRTETKVFLLTTARFSKYLCLHIMLLLAMQMLIYAYIISLYNYIYNFYIYTFIFSTFIFYVHHLTFVKQKSPSKSCFIFNKRL